MEEASKTLMLGDETGVAVALNLGELSADDIRVEMLFETDEGGCATEDTAPVILEADSLTPSGETVFRAQIQPRESGLRFYRLRAYPYHAALTHRFETGKMVWV